MKKLKSQDEADYSLVLHMMGIYPNDVPTDSRYTILEHIDVCSGVLLKTPESIIDFIERYLARFPELTGTSRKRVLVDKRRYLMYVLKKKTELSLSEIGDIFGNRDHSTVLWNIKKHKLFTEINDDIYRYNTKEIHSLFKQLIL